MNNRLGHFENFLEAVDDIPPRKKLDHTWNGHGTCILLADFLLFSNMCVLNGRSDNDDFTCVSTKAAFVFDNYSCGLSTATIEYSSPSACLCVCVSVCVSVCAHDNSKIMVQST